MSLEKLGPKVSHDGSKQEITVEDDNALTLLSDVLKELKILNLHMNVMTDNKFTKQDVN